MYPAGSDNKPPALPFYKSPPLPVFTFIVMDMKYIVLATGLCLLGCHSSQKVYQAPAVGAEAQFDRGLRPEKHPKYLFDKKTMKEMQKQGAASSDSSKRRNTAPTIPLPGKGANGKDSTNMPADSLHMATDSARTVIDSSHAPMTPADSTHSPLYQQILPAIPYPHSPFPGNSLLLM